MNKLIFALSLFGVLAGHFVAVHALSPQRADHSSIARTGGDDDDKGDDDDDDDDEDFRAVA